MLLAEGLAESAVKHRADQAIKTLGVIIRSSSVREYAIGVAKTPCHSRAASYRQWWKQYGDAHLVVLIDGLDAKAALDSEAYIHSACKSKHRGSAYVRKLSEDKDKFARRSLGGRTPLEGDSYSVYLAWLTPRG